MILGTTIYQASRVWRKAGERRELRKVKVKQEKSGPVNIYVISVLNDLEGKPIADYNSPYNQWAG